MIHNQLFFSDYRHFQQVLLQAGLQGPVAVNGNGQAHVAAGLAVDVMAAVDPQESPAALLQEMGEFLPGEGFHTAISRTRPLGGKSKGLRSTERHPSTAS